MKITLKKSTKKYTISDVIEKQSVISDEFNMNQEELMSLTLKTLENLISVLYEKDLISDKDVIKIIKHSNMIDIENINHG